MKKLTDRKGFTLAELLVVVAIVAVLVAISIPIFTSQLEKARESTDVANMRAAKAEAVSAYLSESIDPGTYKYDADNGKLVASDATVAAYGKGTTKNGKTKYGSYEADKAYTDKVVETIISDDGDVTVTWA